MNNNLEIGKKGETLAEKYLLENGFTIFAKNYRFKRAEIDLIAEKNNLLVFVEVKMRSNNSFGDPESAVKNPKEKLLKTAAENYIFEINWQFDIRFDIIAITRNQKPEIVHFEDVFN